MAILTESLTERLKILKQAAFVFFIAWILASCTSLYAYSIVLFTKYDGAIVLENEKNVELYLENLIQNYNDDSIDYPINYPTNYPMNCSMKAFNRKAISYKVQKTSSTTRS
jgi:hypothetical protein